MFLISLLNTVIKRCLSKKIVFTIYFFILVASITGIKEVNASQRLKDYTQQNIRMQEQWIRLKDVSFYENCEFKKVNVSQNPNNYIDSWDVDKDGNVVIFWDKSIDIYTKNGEVLSNLSFKGGSEFIFVQCTSDGNLYIEYVRMKIIMKIDYDGQLIDIWKVEDPYGLTWENEEIRTVGEYNYFIISEENQSRLVSVDNSGKETTIVTISRVEEDMLKIKWNKRLIVFLPLIWLAGMIAFITYLVKVHDANQKQNY